MRLSSSPKPDQKGGVSRCSVVLVQDVFIAIPRSSTRHLEVHITIHVSGRCCATHYYYAKIHAPSKQLIIINFLIKTVWDLGSHHPLSQKSPARPASLCVRRAVLMHQCSFRMSYLKGAIFSFPLKKVRWIIWIQSYCFFGYNNKRAAPQVTHKKRLLQAAKLRSGFSNSFI